MLVFWGCIWGPIGSFGHFLHCLELRLVLDARHRFLLSVSQSLTRADLWISIFQRYQFILDHCTGALFQDIKVAEWLVLWDPPSATASWCLALIGQVISDHHLIATRMVSSDSSFFLGLISRTVGHLLISTYLLLLCLTLPPGAPLSGPTLIAITRRKLAQILIRSAL